MAAIRPIESSSGVDMRICLVHRDWDQLTAVIAAASAGQLDMVKFLIDSNADVNAKDKVRGL